MLKKLRLPCGELLRQRLNATTINIVGLSRMNGGHRPPVVQGPLAVPPAFAKYCWPCVDWSAGSMGVDLSDRKLINDAPAALRIEDRLLSVLVSSLLTQLEVSTWIADFQISNRIRM